MGGSKEALEEGVWGRNLEKVSLPLARPNQAASGWQSTTLLPIPQHHPNRAADCPTHPGNPARSQLSHQPLAKPEQTRKELPHGRPGTSKLLKPSPAKQAADKAGAVWDTSGVPLSGSR